MKDVMMFGAIFALLLSLAVGGCGRNTENDLWRIPSHVGLGK